MTYGIGNPGPGLR